MRFTAVAQLWTRSENLKSTTISETRGQELGLGLGFPEELYKLIKLRASTAILSERAPFDTFWIRLVISTVRAM